MSTKLTGYVWDGCAASGMKLSSVAIMARLADFSNDEGVCWPSIETIARQIGAGMSTVRTAIGRLEAEGWLTEQQTLLSHGVATAYVESGVLRIQRDVTTYRKNAYGVADNSYLDSETLHTSAYVLRKLKSVITSKYGRHKLASDGTRFGPGQAIVTPAVIKGELLATYRQLERAGIVENYELFKQYLVVERDASDPNRLNTLFPPDYVNQLRVFAVVNQFRLQYSEESA
ncbi:GntR family transcriptional regulator [Escherichia coli]|nr:GntR family transcriptional regulator [Escherichia coli]